MYLLYEVVSNLILVTLKSWFIDVSLSVRWPSGELKNYSRAHEAADSVTERPEDVLKFSTADLSFLQLWVLPIHLISPMKSKLMKPSPMKGSLVTL
jgi:hypothetical protein